MSYTCMWKSEGPAFTDHFKGDLSYVEVYIVPVWLLIVFFFFFFKLSEKGCFALSDRRGVFV